MFGNSNFSFLANSEIILPEASMAVTFISLGDSSFRVSCSFEPGTNGLGTACNENELFEKASSRTSVIAFAIIDISEGSLAFEIIDIFVFKVIFIFQSKLFKIKDAKNFCLDFALT